MSTASGQLLYQTVATALMFAALGIVIILRRRTTNLSSPVTAPDGVMPVAVGALYMRQGGLLGAKSHNSINPQFAVAPDAIHFKLFRKSRLPFASIEHIEVRERFGRVYLLFLNTAAPRLLSANVRDRATAKSVLDALPRSITLTPEAATIRDGVPAAGASGLNLYGGRFW
jgi:hypothetical protein